MNEHNQIPEDILKNRKSLIQQPGVYLLFDKEEVVYVGQSLNAEQRINQHSSSNKIFDSYYIEHCDEEYLKTLEIDYILKYLPKYNKIIPLPKSNSSLFPIGQITPTQNKRILIPCIIMHDKLYADLSKVEFKLVKMHGGFGAIKRS